MRFGGSLGLPFPTCHAAVAGFGSPLSGARGARLRVPGSPVRRRSRAPVSVGPDPLSSVVLSLVSLAGPRRTPSPVPRRLSGGGGWRGDRAAVSSFRKRSYDS